MAQTVKAARRNVSTLFRLLAWPSRATRHRLVHHHRPTFTIDTQYGAYIWKGVSRYRQKVRLAQLGNMLPTHPTNAPISRCPCWPMPSSYQVFAEYDLENPVASCYLHHSLSPNKPVIILQSAGEPLRDDIVVAYLVQRHRVEMENRALNLFVGPIN